MKRFSTYLAVVCLTLSFCIINVANAQVVKIPDRNLAAAVRDTLGLTPNEQITIQHMQNLTALDAREKEIKDLSGLEHATQLVELRLWNNEIRNIKPLEGLTQLRFLGLDGNQISNVRPIIGLTQLEGLYLQGNQINNNAVRLLANLTQLKGLSLNANQISNIRPLADLTNLESLWLIHNQIRDISPLAGLVNLQTLELRGNPIQDFSPLASLTNLRELDVLGEPGVPEIASPFPSAGPKIEGPWLWMIAPIDGLLGSEAAASKKDWLARASGGTVKQGQIAKNGAIAGDPVGDKVWTWGALAPTGNITEMVNAIGLGSGDIDHHVAYGSISLESPRRQETTMYVGSDDAVKVWLNGRVVHQNPIERGANDYQDSFPVTLKKGKNVLLIAVFETRGGWSGFFGFENDAAYSVIVPEDVSVPVPEIAVPGSKIEGPWLWMIAPTGRVGGKKAAGPGKDWLAKASGGTVKQGQIAKNGAITGTLVGDKIWTPGKLAPTGGDNITEMVNAIGLGSGDIDNHVAYGSISLESPRRQETTMYAGSDDAVKVWLNGRVVHANLIDRAADDYQDFFPVTLKKGKNVLLVAIYELGGTWSGFFGFASGTEYSLIASTPLDRGLIPDLKLAARIRSTLDLGPNAPITETDMRKLTKLTANSQGIEDLTGLEHATRLRSLSLRVNRISDLSPLAELKNLKSLSLFGNRIQGTGPLLALLKENPNLKLDIYVPTDEHPPIYWLTGVGTDGAGTLTLPAKLQRLTSVSANVETLWESSSPVLDNRTQLTIDTVAGKLYWTESIDESRSEIKRINLEGDPNIQTLLTLNSNIGSIAVDPKARRLYWTNSLGRIQRSNLSGKHIKTLVKDISTENSTLDLTLDAEGGKLYWTAGHNIQRANLNGKNIQTVVTASSTTGVVLGIGNIAIADRKIYWNQLESDPTKFPYSINNFGASIRRADLDGSNIEELVADGSVGFDFAVDTAGQALYYTKSPFGTPGSHILRADLNGSEGEVAVYYGGHGPFAIALGSPVDAIAAESMSSSLAAAPQATTPNQTGLLANYPNPFNPETWIPYQLAKASDVKITIYDTRGVVVRKLELGHQPQGFYTDRSRAAYWDGRNTVGERVASGLYFYQLQADNVSLTRKMLILK